MKRIIQYFAAILLVVLGINSCQDNKLVEPNLSLDNVKLNLGKLASETKVNVYCNGAWEASFTESVDWATLEDAKGNGNGAFTIKWQDNPSVARIAEITVKSGNLTETIAIAQEGALNNIVLEVLSGPQSHIAIGGPYKVDFNQNLGELYKDLKSEVIYKDASGTNITPSEAWISNVVVLEDQITYTVAPNHDGTERYAVLRVSIEFPSVKQMNGSTETVVFEGGEYSAEVTITQSLDAGYMRFNNDSETISSHGGEIIIPWEADFGSFISEIKSNVEYSAGSSDWISNIVTSNESVSFVAQANKSRQDRSAIIKLAFDYAGFDFNAELQITQNKQEDEVTFADLRAKLSSAGSIELDGDYITAIVVADGGNLNMATNAQVDWNLIDLETSLTTNYIESTDGQYGMRIRTVTPEDNAVFKSGNSVKVSLAGLTLLREDNPTRYTLSGLVSTSIGGAQTSSLPAKVKGISELTDDDIYTFVTVKDVEIALPYGSYNNVPWGKGGAGEAQCDYAARFLRNAKGEMISMLINGSTPWRFIDKDVPAGSGNVSAVVVWDELLRAPDHKGIGSKYQLRPFNQSDIALDETNSFSTNLITWYFPKGKETWEAGAGYNNKNFRVKSNDGLGWIDCSKAGGMNQSSSFLDLDYVNWMNSSPAAKCIRYSDVNDLWDEANNKAGTYFDLSFPTTSVGTGKNLTLVMNAMTCNTLPTLTTSPLNWVFSYSVDGGKTFKDFATTMIFPWSRYDFKFSTLPGAPTELVLPIPDEAAGKEQVIVRFKAANGLCVNPGTGQFDGPFKNEKIYVRFGAIAVKYNK